MLDMVFLVFIGRGFVSTSGLESFSLRPEKFPKRFSFGGGRVRFFFSFSIAARGVEQQGRNPAQGSRSFGAP